MRQYRIAAIPGDGIGTEVIEAGVEVIQALAKRDGGFELAVENFDWGTDYYLKHGGMMPEDGLEQIQSVDSIFLGAVGFPGVADHEKGRDPDHFAADSGPDPKLTEDLRRAEDVPGAVTDRGMRTSPSPPKRDH